MEKVLLIGQGGREHALALKLSQSPNLSRLFIWPGHRAMSTLGTVWEDLDPGMLQAMHHGSGDFTTLLGRIRQEQITLVVVGPEAPLALGLADQLRAAGIKVFGPEREAARLETDKSFAKEVMAEAGIPTARYQVAHSEEETRQFASEMLRQTGGVVLKASGLASGKGVFVCRNQTAIDQGLQFLFHTEMQSAAKKVVLEQILEGRECSYFSFLGPNQSHEIGFAVDYKRLLDSDEGPNTGGMGCYTPVPWLPPDAGQVVQETVIRPLIKALSSRGLSYVGCLYVGLMWSASGPQVVEFNVRLGDPEAQVLVIQDQRDWLEIMSQCAALDSVKTSVGIGSAESSFVVYPNLYKNISEFTVGVVMTTSSYPYGKDRGQPGYFPLSWFHPSPGERQQVFAASIQSSGAKPGEIETGTGRVFTVIGRGVDFDAARQLAYQKVSSVKSQWPAAKFRTDIARDVSTESLVTP